jgi:Holliday junction DNA helicase RuvB
MDKYEKLKEAAQLYVPKQHVVPFNSGWVPPPPLKPEDFIAETYVNPSEPQNFDEFIGQKFAKDILKIIVDSANKEMRLIPNILMTGAYGHGKTTLAKLVIQRHGKRVQIVDGSNVATTVIPSTTTVYIVDEAHNIPPQLADTYNILIDAGQLRMIACTNKPGLLPAPFRSRFRTIYLTDYVVEDIKAIVINAAKRAKAEISDEAAIALASRSKLNPRNALSLLDFIREISVMESTTDVAITEKAALAGVAQLNIDPLGLTEIDRKYLGLLKPDGGAIGLNYISSVLSIDTDTIQEEIEPYLIQLGLVERTPRGRVAGSKHSIEKIRQQIIESMKGYRHEA